jgi:hypothetical protein
MCTLLLVLGIKVCTDAAAALHAAAVHVNTAGLHWVCSIQRLLLLLLHVKWALALLQMLVWALAVLQHNCAI